MPGKAYTFKGKPVQPALEVAKGVPVSASDFRGTFRETSPGEYTYILVTALPENYDRNATHRVGMQATREARKYVANTVYDFVPAGGEVRVFREVVATENCNRCHDPLSLHGGQRIDTKLCVQCHTPQNIDPETGNTPDFKVMIHKIHRGADLPSAKEGKPYVIVGFNQTPFDPSAIRFPQDIRNCTTCHSKAPQADNWKTAPSRAACGSCHENVDFASGKNHPGGPQANDATCKACHQADGPEFSTAIAGAHTIPERSTQLKGVKFTLMASNVKPGEKPQVDFHIQDNANNFLDPNKFDYLELTLAHPTTDYAHRITEVVNQILPPTAPPFARTGTLTKLDMPGEHYRYTFPGPLEAGWKGTVAVGIGGYKNATIKDPQGKDTVVREGNVNPVIYVSLDGTPATPRRTVVKRDNCNSCHEDLGNPAGISIHGGIRRNTEYCLLCHNANQTDEAYRKDGTIPESVRYAYMIHSLHMGDERAEATEFRGRGVAMTAEVRYPTPGAQKNCAKCHDGQSYTLPLPAGLLPTKVTQKGEVLQTVQPIAAACSGCHASAKVAAHADTMTTSKGAEACAVCHGRELEFAVEKVHRK